MNFAGVRSATIPEGDVRSIAIGGVTVWQKPNPLPYDALVEYVESTGAQYVDTGIVPAYNYGATCRVMRLNVGTGNDAFCLFGVLSAWNNRAWLSVQTNRSGTALYVACGNVSSNRATATVLDVWKTYDLTNGVLSVDGSPFVSVSPSSGVAAGNAYLFCANNVGNGTLYGVTAARRVASCVIRDASGVLVRDLVPVRVGTVGYLYDRANPTGGPSGNGLYGSATSTPLVAGPDKHGG